MTKFNEHYLVTNNVTKTNLIDESPAREIQKPIHVL